MLRAREIIAFWEPPECVHESTEAFLDVLPGFPVAVGPALELLAHLLSHSRESAMVTAHSDRDRGHSQFAELGLGREVAEFFSGNLELLLYVRPALQ